MPTIQASASQKVSSTWIGVDGYCNTNLIQAGTEQDTSGDARTYYSWWEILPAPEQEIGGVSPGDQMSANIFRVSPGTWTIDISDITSSQSFSQNFSYSGPTDSAEWIEEDTSVSSGPVPLANFGTANFTGVNYTTSNAAGNTPTLIDMENRRATSPPIPRSRTAPR